MKMKLLLTVCISIFTSLAYALPVPGYSEGWNVSGDLAGWNPNTTQTNVEVIDSGGNPGGYLHSYGNVAGSFDVGAVYSGSELTGDYGGQIWQVSFDINYLSGRFDDAWLRYRYQDSSYNGWIYDLTDVFNQGEWQSYSVAFDSSWSDTEAVAMGWQQQSTSPSFATLMSDVYTTEIRVSGEGELSVGIDNFRLHSSNVPEPASIVLLVLGLVGLKLIQREQC